MEHSQIILNCFKEKGITKYRVAKDTCISESLFSKWETRPTSEISSRVLIELSNYLDCSTDYLLGRENKQGDYTMNNNAVIFWGKFDEQCEKNNYTLKSVTEELCLNFDLIIDCKTSDVLPNYDDLVNIINFFNQTDESMLGGSLFSDAQNEKLSYLISAKLNEIIEVDNAGTIVVDSVMYMSSQVDRNEMKNGKFKFDAHSIKYYCDICNLSIEKMLCNDISNATLHPDEKKLIKDYRTLSEKSKKYISDAMLAAIKADNDTRIVARKNRTKPAVQKKKPRNT